ncbi:MAG: phosphate acyltransferase PlsX [Gammaproteobacteria bacterium]|nr:phosphate acyltransferase PlsX [Gammaproteobacteria bacterium]
MSGPVTLSIDAMSGDHGHPVAVDAALSVLARHPALKLVLVGDEPTLLRALAERKAAPYERLAVQHASEVVEMHEQPSKALRGKRDSSMRVAINLVKEGRAQAAVSAGNTGALMAMARFVLKTLPGIDRPAIISAIPSIYGHTHMLDLGANAECNAEQLFQFAVMGAALATAVHGIASPKVGLLNIGEEEIKGNETIKQAAALLQGSSIDYIGFVEGDGIFLDDVDVVVCDGFVGNVALKTGEGVAKMIRRFMQEEFTRNWLHRLAAVAAYPALSGLGKRIDPRRYNGASFLGLQGTVIKSHGSADAVAFANAIEVAITEVEKDVPARISTLLQASLASRPQPPQAAAQG